MAFDSASATGSAPYTDQYGIVHHPKPATMTAYEKQRIDAMCGDTREYKLRRGVLDDDAYEHRPLSDEGMNYMRSLIASAKTDWPLASVTDGAGRPEYWTSDARGA